MRRYIEEKAIVRNERIFLKLIEIKLVLKRSQFAFENIDLRPARNDHCNLRKSFRNLFLLLLLLCGCWCFLF